MPPKSSKGKDKDKGKKAEEEKKLKPDEFDDMNEIEVQFGYKLLFNSKNHIFLSQIIDNYQKSKYSSYAHDFQLKEEINKQMAHMAELRSARNYYMLERV